MFVNVRFACLQTGDRLRATAEFIARPASERWQLWLNNGLPKLESNRMVDITPPGLPSIWRAGPDPWDCPQGAYTLLVSASISLTSAHTLQRVDLHRCYGRICESVVHSGRATGIFAGDRRLHSGSTGSVSRGNDANGFWKMLSTRVHLM